MLTADLDNVIYSVGTIARRHLDKHTGDAQFELVVSDPAIRSLALRLFEIRQLIH